MSNLLIYRGPITGLSFGSYGQHMNKLAAGKTLLLKRDLSNVHDDYAVAVYLEDRDDQVQLGWIPKGRNITLADYMDKQGLNYLPAHITQHDTSQTFANRLYIQVYGSESQIPEPKHTNTESVISSRHHSPSKEFTMNTSIKSIYEANKQAATSAAFMEAGRMANDKAAQILSKKAPMMVRGYIDTPVGKLVIANLAAVALAELRPKDARAHRLANAMQVQAYTEVIRKFDLDSMMDDLLSNVTVKKALKVLDSEKQD